MKTIKIIQWVGYVVLVTLGTWAILVAAVTLTGVLFPESAVVGALFALILVMGAGLVWSFTCVVFWGWLADRGWFLWGRRD